MILTADKISRSFLRGSREFYAVKEADITLEGGKMTVLRGRSGSGKTTLLNILAGLQAPSSGKVIVDNAADLYSLDDRALSRFRNDHYGIVPQGQSAVATLTVLENILLPGTIYGRDDRIPDRAGELMERMGITHLKDAFPGELSGGEMRRMAIARALIRDPQVLFADEPTSDLDDDNRDTVFTILRNIADEGKAVFVVTHERSASEYSDDLYLMDAGVISLQSDRSRHED
ncbi:MAG: ABC transporter ATP-binding protein [Lachnospiraceae bacterium]|nr:ABC transporter ATP-binding protein [Lachnospiraceae bacterium]